MNFVRRFALAAAAFFSVLKGSGSEQVIRLLESTANSSAEARISENSGDDTASAYGRISASDSSGESAAALHLLAILQREGRLVDFLQEDIGGFSDEQVGAAVRSVHAGCRKALAECIPLKPIICSDEGSSVTVSTEEAGKNVTLTGNLSGQGPFRGILCHRGWRAESIALPKISADRDLSVIAPAEVEI